ncbi:protein involved in plasmid replication-relaxation [Prosthecobacter fusiformis]|uniref:Protein involved in plasmid replication-relaxation n=1 Tax=Prosthecobacter fusiformis TaxID=48464 RepID=A0A4R7SRK7_9BACT|nr:replication-relaxation family protein [Prosthecobacter fusiformis]TDU80797.1 protein involved in plasmid replication-relaxation [Prosthecobacter fusiformis]
MHQSRPRKPRFKRVTDSVRLILTERDLAILSAVGRHRFIQSHHLLKLIPGSRQHLIRRLGRLFHAGLLDRPVQQMYVRDKIGQKIAYCLTSQGLKVLSERASYQLLSLPRQKGITAALSLFHSLRVTDVLVAMEFAATARALAIRWPQEWPSGQSEIDRRPVRLKWSVTLKTGREVLKTWQLPDGAFSLSSADGEPRYYILEVDRGTMPVHRKGLSQSSFYRKILSYKETRRQGVLWSRFHIPAFRVLVVAESRRRLFSLQQATASTFKNRESKMFLFAVASELLEQGDALSHGWETCSGKKVYPLME